jgi:hypothetical protein
MTDRELPRSLGGTAMVSHESARHEMRRRLAARIPAAARGAILASTEVQYYSSTAVVALQDYMYRYMHVSGVSTFAARTTRLCGALLGKTITAR